jgi:RNA polymerase sigma-70 factor (ECF subfamily)
VVGAVSLVTGSLASAEDAVQEAVVRAWERTERGEPIERIDAWVTTVALNLSRSAIRRAVAERRARGRLAAVPVDAPPPSADRVDLQRALAALPPRQREAVILRSLLELRIDEIARAMGTSDGTVKSQLSKARAHLAAALALDPDTEQDHADA